MKTDPTSRLRQPDGAIVGQWWHPASKEGRLDCMLCPRQCSLSKGDRGFCFVRENRDDQIVLTTYGRSTGFCIDPIEKKPLNHFLPGTPVLSFGTAGCNLGCQFCQNWDISKSRQIERLSEVAEPSAIAAAAVQTGCRSVAFTYNDPVIWAEYAIDTAYECRRHNIKTVAVTAGYISPEARGEFFQAMDAANVDLKGFTELFYSKVTYSHLQPVLETLHYLIHETNVWVELTNLIIPQLNDDRQELQQMCQWILEHLGENVPVHFTAFHPDFRMLDRPSTDPETLLKASEIARSVGLRYVYVGNVRDQQNQSTYCPNCQALLIERQGYQLGRYDIIVREQDPPHIGRCKHCNQQIPGHFESQRGDWGSRRLPIHINQYASASISSTTTQRQLPIQTRPMQSSQESRPVTTSQPSSPTIEDPKPLNLDRLNQAQREQCLQLAATTVAAAVTGQPIKADPGSIGEFMQSIVMGAFVTLKRGELLRGCCGVLGKPMSVGNAISSAAIRTAREDQRMAPISPSELPYLNMDITLLGPMHRLTGKGADRAQEIQIGKHGVMIQREQNSGLLLPSVATERGWGAEQFLRAVCGKAQLPSDAWQKDDSVVMSFVGQTISQSLESLLPTDLPPSKVAPLTLDQVADYAQIVGHNIVAFATGGTPSYVIPQLPDVTVNALVLSLQWGHDSAAATENPDESNSNAQQFSPTQQGNAVQVSFRPGIPLQANLYQMAQHAGQMFVQQRFQGELKIGLTLGFDPAMHGFGSDAQLNGVNTAERGLVVSDARHCGFVFNPHHSAAELHKMLIDNLPIGSRQSAVHSVHVVSTMPQAICLSVPPAMPASGVRAPAVAGKFYPAEDAARRAMVDALCGRTSAPKRRALAAMVPHAGLKYSGRVAGQVWQALALEPEQTILIFSPKHTAQGVNWAVCPYDSWAISDKVHIAGNSALARQLCDQIDGLQLDAAAHAAEHGIEVQLPILEKVAPTAKVVGVAVQGGSWDEIQHAAAQLADWIQSQSSPPLMVISSDMNHYADDTETRLRDRLALDALANGDPQQLIQVCRQHEISMCGLIPAALVMETLRQSGSSFRVEQLGYATSGDVSADKSSVVGYAGLLLVE